MYKPISITTLLLALNAGGCATLESSTPVSVPEALKPAGNESLALVVPAKGVQIYECRAAKSQPGAYEWAFLAPDASLFDLHGNTIGRHYGGPHWESTDGSKVKASLKARADAPAGDAIPWLLLAAHSVGPDGAFSKVTSIQRANTAGGMAPRNGCSQTTAGTMARVDYTAHYYFFTAR